MNIAVACGLIILVLLVIMLLAGVPIAVALAVSSICAILPVLDTGAASAYRGTEDFFRYFRIQPSCHPVLYPGRKSDEQRRYCDPPDQFCKAVYR